MVVNVIVVVMIVAIVIPAESVGWKVVRVTVLTSEGGSLHDSTRHEQNVVTERKSVLTTSIDGALTTRVIVEPTTTFSGTMLVVV